MSSGKCKLKQGIIVTPTGPIQNTDTECQEDVEQQELSFMADGSAKWSSDSGGQLSSFLQN